MSVSAAKLIAEDLDSLRPSSQQTSDAAVMTGDGSNTSNDADELCDELQKTRSDAEETQSQEMTKPGCKLSSVSVDSEVLPPSLTDAVLGKHLTGSDDVTATSTVAEDQVKAQSEESVKGESKGDSAVSSVGAESEILPASDVHGEQLSGDADVVAAVAQVKMETQSEEMVKAESKGGSELSFVGADSKLLAMSEQLSGISDTVATRPRDGLAVSNATAMSHDRAINQDEGNIVEKLGCSEDKSLCQRTVAAADKLTYDMKQLSAAMQNTDRGGTAVLSGDGDTATDTQKSEEFELVTPTDLSADDQTPDATSTLTDQSAIVQPGTDIDKPAAAVDIETEESTSNEPSIRVLVSDIPRGLDETVEMYLESEKKGGGKIVLFKYNRRSGSALVEFADNKGERWLLALVMSCAYCVLTYYVK